MRSRWTRGGRQASRAGLVGGSTGRWAKGGGQGGQVGLVGGAAGGVGVAGTAGDWRDTRLDS